MCFSTITFLFSRFLIHDSWLSMVLSISTHFIWISNPWGCCASEMATGAAVPTTFSTLKTWDSSLGFAKNIDFVRVSDMKSMKSSARKRVSIIRNSNPGQDIAELQPASPGSPLLGMIAFFLWWSFKSSFF